MSDGLDLPPSSYLSPQARDVLVAGSGDYGPINCSSVQCFRSAMRDCLFLPSIEKARLACPVTVEAVTIDGVPTFRVTPSDRAPAPEKIVIGLHGGGFRMGGGDCCVADAIPIAAASGLTVVSVDYRLAPEHPFPSARDDVLTVYHALLGSHAAQDIAIYGFDAGGTLASMTIAALIAEGSPLPCAAGIFSAAATFVREGDSMTLAPLAMGQSEGARPNPLMTSGKALAMIDEATGQPPRPFVDEAALADPTVTADRHPDILRRFPPTLFMVGGRAPPLSAATTSHRRMLLAGAQADLVVWDGLWHTAFYDVDLPEAREAHALAGRFLNRHLGTDVPTAA